MEKGSLMSDQTLVQPTITVLTKDQVHQIHESALAILSQTGIQVESERALKLLAGHDGVKVSENRATFAREVVDWALQVAPSHFDVYNRLGEHVFRMGDGRTRFGIGCTTLHYQDPISGKTVPFNRKHMVKMVRLGNVLPNYDTISTIGILQDVAPDVADLYATLEMVANTTKPLVVLVSDEDLFPATLDMLESLTGDLAEKPYIIPYFNPITPLVINRGTIDKMFAAIERGLPFIYNSYGLSGTTSPMTAAGVLAMLVAEQLAGLILSQIIKEGAEIVLGFLPAYVDMQTMVNFYDPISYLLNLAGSEIMSHYNIPYSGTGGGATGWGPDFMTAASYWMNHLPAVMSKVDFVGFVGNSMTGKIFSPVNVVTGHEIITQALKFSQGFQLDDEHVGLSDIHERGPGGHFLSTALTRKHMRQAYYKSPIYPRINFEKWTKLGQPDAVMMLKEYTRDLLDNLSPPEDYLELLKKGEKFIQSL
jgi:trimethylamine--corrinoid protein Co-methyltransferase